MTTYILKKLPLILILLCLLSPLAGAVPSLEVTVFDAGGKVTFKGPTSSNGTFATRNLKPGNYVVQFNTKSAVVKGNQYLLVVSAGSKKVIAAAVPGETFLRGGAAMKMEVGPGLRITGQAAHDRGSADERIPTSRMINGKRYVWVAPETGTNLPGHWVEEGLAPARNVIALNSEAIRRKQDRAGEGSMISYSHQHGGHHVHRKGY